MDVLKEIEHLIAEMDDRKREATAELISYKASEKQMAADVAAKVAKAAEWEKKAMAAVTAGDDGLARAALVERQRCELEAEQIDKDRREMAHYAAGLLKSRREFDRRLADLKARKHTLATQIAAARGGGDDALAPSGGLFDDMERLENKIEDEAVLAEIDALVGPSDEAEEARLREQMKRAEADLALAALKKKMK